MKKSEQQKILQTFSNGKKMLAYYEAIGMKALSDFKGEDANEIAMRIDIYLGGKHINKLCIKAIQNVVDAANICDKNYIYGRINLSSPSRCSEIISR